MKLRLITILVLMVCVAGAAYAEAAPDPDVLLEKAAQDAGKEAARLLNVANLRGLRNVVMMDFKGDESGIAGIIETELSKATGLKFGAFDDVDREVGGDFRKWLFDYGDPTKFPDDIDERADEITHKWHQNPRIDGLIYGQVLGTQADDKKAIVRVIIKIVDLRADEDYHAMDIPWQRYIWGEYRSPALIEMTEKQKRFFRKAAEEALKKAMADLGGKRDRLEGIKRVIVIPVADDVQGMATNALTVALGNDGTLAVVTRSKDEFDQILEEIRFNTEFGDVASVKITNPPKGLVNLADAIILGKVVSREATEDESRVNLDLRLIKIEGSEQSWAFTAEGRYRDPKIADPFLIIVAVVLVGCIAMFFVTSGLKNIQKKHVEKRKEKKEEGKRKEAEVEEKKRRVEAIDDALRQDESLRNRMVGELAGARQILKKAQNDSQAAGKSDEAGLVKKSVNGLDNLIRRIEAASYGNAELFKAGKISDKELNSLVGFERKMEAVIKDVSVEAEGASAAVASGDYVTLLDRLRDLDKKVVELSNKFTDRDRYIRETR